MASRERTNTNFQMGSQNNEIDSRALEGLTLLLTLQALKSINVGQQKVRQQY